MNALKVFGIFLLVRLASVFLVETWFVPDEYWQSLEVAHKLVYGYGYLTWEWTSGIRSYIHPLIFGILYKILNYIGLDSAFLLTFAPRVLQALLSAYSDFCFWKLCGKTKWSIFCISTSWFWFYTGSRTLINTIETCLTTIALSRYPFRKSAVSEKQTSINFVPILGLMCAMRPTAAIVWTPLCLYHLHNSPNKLRTIISEYIPSLVIILILSTTIDSLCHGSFVVTWYEFLKMNVVNGIGAFYGTHPWHWYLSQGLPAILGVQLIPFMLATTHILKNREAYVDELALLLTVTFTVAVYSTLAHKEFRFLLSLLPIMLYITSQYLTMWSRKANDVIIWVVVAVIFLGNAVPALYLGQFHQRGTIDVMTPLKEIATKDPVHTNLLFLMPCHSTPFYSHLHVNVSARFLTCNPNLAKVDGYIVEADHFYNSPSAWLRNNYPPTKPLPSHLIFFDVLTPFLSDILSRYKPVQRFYHMMIQHEDSRTGKYVLIYQLVNN